ncbi:MAG: enoyl-CoA hydratase [Aquabacterium sp.]
MTTQPAGDGIVEYTLPGEKSLHILGRASIDRGIAELAALAPAAQRGELRVLVLRGPGETFIGGADIREMAQLTPATAPSFIQALRGLCEAVRVFPCPVVARLAGWCLGGGLEVAAACDIRIAGRGARFGMPETKVGIPSVIHAALLPRLIGRSRAAWLLLSGETIDAATAQQWSFVHELADDTALDDAVHQRATALAAMGAAVLRQQKRMLRQWESQSADAAIEASVAEFAAAFATGEPQRHMGAFLARKR